MGDLAAKKAKEAAAAAARKAKQLKDAAKAALDKAVALAKAAALAVAKAACRALQFMLDKVIATVITTIAKAGVNAIMSAGKMIAKGMAKLGGGIDNILRVERIYYAGSLKQAVQGNFGRFEFAAYIMKKKFELKVTLDIKK